MVPQAGLGAKRPPASGPQQPAAGSIRRRLARGHYHAAMRLTPWEEERLLIFSAAELARRHRSVGLRLNHPEAVALICDAMLEAARAGATYLEVEAAGRSAVRPEELMDGVRALVDEVRLEVLLGDGTRLVVLVDPLGPNDPLAAPPETSGAGSATLPGTVLGPGAGPDSTGGGRA